MRNRHVPQHRSRVRILRQEMSFRYLAVGLLLVVLLSLVSGNSRARDEDEVALAYPVALQSIGLDAVLAQDEFQSGYLAYEQEEYSLARRYWEPLARQGHASSQYYMGILHDSGAGVTLDPRLAFDWYARAAKQGHPEAQQNWLWLMPADQGWCGI